MTVVDADTLFEVIVSRTSMAEREVKRYKEKHLEDLRHAASVMLTHETSPEGYKNVGFERPFCTVTTGALRINLPAIKGFIVFPGRFNANLSLGASVGPFPGLCVLLNPLTGVWSEYFLPFDNGTNVVDGVAVLPIAASLNSQPSRYVASSANMSLGSQATALSLPGGVGTAAVGDFDNTVSIALTSSGPIRSPTGSWVGAFGPVTNDLSRSQNVIRSNERYLQAGAYAMDDSLSPLYMVIPAGWSTTGNLTPTPAINTSFTTPLFTVSRNAAGTSPSRFLFSMSEPARMRVNISGIRAVGTSGAYTNWFTDTVTCTFTYTTVNSSGTTVDQSVTLTRSIQDSVLATVADNLRSPCLAVFDFPVPAFTHTISVNYTHNAMSLGTVTGFALQNFSASVVFEQDPTLLRPAVFGTNLSSQTSVLLTLSAIAALPATPSNVLLLGANPINAATDELAHDLEGVMSSHFRGAALVAPGDLSVVRVPEGAMTPHLEKIAVPTTESGTFALLPLLGSVARAVLPGLISTGADFVSNLMDKRREGGGAPNPPPPTVAPQRSEELIALLTQLLQTMRSPKQSDTAMSLMTPSMADKIQKLAGVTVNQKSKKKKNKSATSSALIHSVAIFACRGRVCPDYDGPMSFDNGTLTLGDGRTFQMDLLAGEMPTFPVLSFRYENGLGIIRAAVSSTGTQLINEASLTELFRRGKAVYGIGIIPTSELNDEPSIESLPPRRVVCAADREPCVQNPLGNAGLLLVDGCRRGRDACSPFYGTLWALFVTDDPAVIVRDGVYRPVDYVATGSCAVDRRLLLSFRSADVPDFLSSISHLSGYLSSVCSADTGNGLHLAYGGSLMAGAYQVLLGALTPGLVISGSPFSARGPAVATHCRQKEIFLRRLADLGGGYFGGIPVSGIPTRVLSLATSNRSPPTMDKLKEFFAVAAASSGPPTKHSSGSVSGGGAGTQVRSLVKGAARRLGYKVDVPSYDHIGDRAMW